MSLNMFHLSIHRKCCCTLSVDFLVNIFNLIKKIIQKILQTLRKKIPQMMVESFIFFYRTHSPIVFIALPRNSFYSIACSSYNFSRILKWILN